MFPYFGAKHKLARYYPEPEYPVIIEPFAGAAGYSCFHADKIERAILTDADPAVVDLWHRLQSMTVADLMAIECPRVGERTSDPLIALSAGRQGQACLHGTESPKVTARMSESWPRIQNRMARLLPITRDWIVTCGSYDTTANIEATWFVDPPYQSLQSVGGSNNYAVRDIDFPALAEWCVSRNGQLLVCEQRPADWLPFVDFRRQVNGSNRPSTRQEVIYTRSRPAMEMAA